MSDIRTDRDSIDVYENDIELYISLFCEKYNIEDLSKESQNRWNALLNYLYTNIFKGTTKLKVKNNINNAYDKEYIYYYIIPLYVNLCNLYSKEVSINGFTKFTGIEDWTVYDWKDDSSSFGSRIFQKLMQENENSNSDLLTLIKNPVGVMARLNHAHSWNMPGVQTQKPKEQKADFLPNFGEAAAIEVKAD